MNDPKKWYHNYKGIIMAFNKVIRLGSEHNQIFFWRIILALLLLPFIPIVYYIKVYISEKLIVVGIFYFILYLFISVFLANYLVKIGKTWNEKEYDELTPDMTTFPFLLFLIIYGSFNFTVFYLISLLL